MPALRRETGQGSSESATTDRWLTVKDLERGSFLLDSLASSYRVLGLPPLTCCRPRFGKSRELLEFFFLALNVPPCRRSLSVCLGFS